MLSLTGITLFQFKNYTNRVFSLDHRVIGICGNNGVGKTNLLDAIYYLCFTKSYFTRLDSQLVKQGFAGFRIEGDFLVNGKKEKAVCIYRENGKKEFQINGQAYDKFSQHIGRYPCVIIAPDDAQLITGGSEERRRFLDALLSQLDATYLQQLITYNKVLQQRNSLLKSMAETGRRDAALLDVLDVQLIAPANYVADKRRDFLVSFLPAVKHLYQEIARQPEEISLIYESELLQQSFQDLLTACRQRDMMAQRTTAGPHRDDISLQYNDQSFKSVASQGQRKSLLFALKLAEMEVLQREKGFAPLLLLDDVFEKLDEDRIRNLLDRVCNRYDGQVIITDTHEERLRNHFEELQLPFGLIKV
ncbi:MAG: DNA replication and repair protein RecF [Chitinophagaceae bacterium]|nr:DNA replication and repair protein RecF [Chitinophagaceae bacterium]